MLFNPFLGLLSLLLKFPVTLMIRLVHCFIVSFISHSNNISSYGKNGNAIGRIIILTTVAMMINGNPAFT